VSDPATWGEGRRSRHHELGPGDWWWRPGDGFVIWNREFLTRSYSGALLLFDNVGGEKQ
jgi:hypothetical protein